MTVTYIVPTIGRSSLARTLASIETRPEDEILVVSEEPVQEFIYNRPEARHIPCPRGNDWGHAERNFATPLAKGKYIAHIDDDDCYVPGTRALFEEIMQTGRPAIFKMRFPNGITLWREPKIACGNLGTPCLIILNDPAKLGSWGSFVGGDCAFLESSKWAAEDYVWRPEVIALLGHDIGVAV